VHQDATTFGELLRQLRNEARLTQEELAEKTGLSPRSISDLERGISRTAQKTTAGLLGDALGISDAVRTLFVAVARGRAPIAALLAALDGVAPASTVAQADTGVPANTGAPASEGSVVTGVWLIWHDGIRWHRGYVPLAGGVLWFMHGWVSPASD
jgi:transcriptional regulator with XRE-family HTH domain